MSETATIGTCKTCRHWRATNSDPECKWGVCSQIVAPTIDLVLLKLNLVGFCSDELAKKQGHERPSTSSEFGCIKYEVRDG